MSESTGAYPVALPLRAVSRICLAQSAWTDFAAGCAAFAIQSQIQRVSR
jgi:hypothetical protein